MFPASLLQGGQDLEVGDDDAKFTRDNLVVHKERWGWVGGCKSEEEGEGCVIQNHPKWVHFRSANLVSQLVNNPPAMWETWVRSLGWEDLLEKGKATHSSILAWRILWTIHVSKSQTQLSDFHFHFSTCSWPQKHEWDWPCPEKSPFWTESAKPQPTLRIVSNINVFFKRNIFTKSSHAHLLALFRSKNLYLKPSSSLGVLGVMTLIIGHFL